MLSGPVDDNYMFKYCNMVPHLFDFRHAHFEVFFVTGLMRSKHQKMQRMAHQSYFSFMEATLARSPICLGILARTGSLLVLLKITSFKYGRWRRTSTMMRMICLVTNHKKHLSLQILNLKALIYGRIKRCMMLTKTRSGFFIVC